ncbi:LytR C-terminal domain-containing protein [Tessaracoccus sp. MC1865]|uniref:LytR C-terminal domain-containing protein n=1 Tax=unclassified Tessaracoccus TaxID=2635419 RepID=UPI00160107B0|nr:LytR C-terminal domain-containing protein [Tessaracoccus sp. MC1865]MBB1482753.1 LytR C-terminal domain-containing protein [Tessaracoccus sp. MC1865]MBB1509952.1 LytR C-terminal domain-containing protein [Tessaracoccus sp. MC1756]QTO37800.1 LytR C-terminal domain-containing protein [Tessaracoccus sp. MC1865]
MRIFRLIATPVILLGLLGFLGWGFLWGWRELTAPLPTTPPTPCVTEATEFVNPTMVFVHVYNGGFTSGLARRIGTQLTDGGYNVVSVDDTEETIKETVIRGNKDQYPAMRLLMSNFIDPKIEYDDRIDGTLDVLVGTAWQGYAPTEQIIYQVSSAGGSICRPPVATDESASPSPSPTTES